MPEMAISSGNGPWRTIKRGHRASTTSLRGGGMGCSKQSWETKTLSGDTEAWQGWGGCWGNPKQKGDMGGIERSYINSGLSMGGGMHFRATANEASQTRTLTSPSILN